MRRLRCFDTFFLFALAQGSHEHGRCKVFCRIFLFSPAASCALVGTSTLMIAPLGSGYGRRHNSRPIYLQLRTGCGRTPVAIFWNSALGPFTRTVFHRVYQVLVSRRRILARAAVQKPATPIRNEARPSLQTWLAPWQWARPTQPDSATPISFQPWTQTTS